MKGTLENIHPGEILSEEFIKPFNLSQTKVARGIAVSLRRINEIVLGKRSVTADTAFRLALYFGTTEQFWMGLQDDYDLEEVKREKGDQIISAVVPLKPVI